MVGQSTELIGVFLRSFVLADADFHPHSHNIPELGFVKSGCKKIRIIFVSPLDRLRRMGEWCPLFLIHE